MTRVAIFSPYREHNGDTRAMPLLACALAEKGYEVDLLRSWEEWEGASLVSGVRVVGLGTKRFAPILPDIGRVSKMAAYRVQMAVIAAAMAPGFISYLRRDQPDVLIARMLTGPATIWTTLAHVRTKLVLASGGVPHGSRFRRLLWPRLHHRAHAFVASNSGVAEAASKITGIALGRYQVIHEAVIGDDVLALAEEPVDHPWFHKGAPPVIVGLGG